MQTKNTTDQQINETNTFFFKAEQIQPIFRYTNQRKKRHDSNKIRHEKWEIITDTTEVQGIKKEFY
jgi:hypothetical protein